ncbi:MAG TPA: hypothetical protein VFB38_17130 [Chthonomonadaceae bacterium]|nr:hypothetical protein [Chthonomonadaceae bacterium]
MDIRLLASNVFDDHRCYVCGHLFELGHVAAAYERDADWIGYICDACVALGEQAVRLSLYKKAIWLEAEAARLREDVENSIQVKISACVEHMREYMRRERDRDARAARAEEEIEAYLERVERAWSVKK